MYAQLLSCVLTFCDPLDFSLPVSSNCGIFQTKILEWVAISSSRGFSQPRDQTHVSCILLHWQMDSLSVAPRWGFSDGSMGKESSCKAGDTGETSMIPGLGRSPGEGNGNPFQYSCLENPMDGGAWQVTVHGVTKSWTRLVNFTLLLQEKGQY